MASSASCIADAKNSTASQRSFNADTGFIDSLRDLGISTPAEDRILVRKALECAPLKTKPYMTTWGWNETSPESLMDYNYGPPTFDNTTSATFQARAANYFGNTMIRYRIETAFKGTGVSFQSVNWTASDFTPIDDIAIANADTNLLFLQNRVKYPVPVVDPWFNALIAERTSDGFPSVSSEYLYSSGSPVLVLGCTEQYAICGISQCTDLGSLPEIMDQILASRMKMNKQQTALAVHLTKILAMCRLQLIWNTVDTTFLLADNNLLTANIVSAPLPPDQWKKEVANWLRVMRVIIQQLTLDYATGPPTDAVYIDKPSPGTPEHDLCNSKITKSSKHSSFSVLGLVIIYVIGGAIIALDLLAPTIHKWLLRKRNPHVQHSWVQDDFLHLQQRAFEEAGIGTWKEKEKSIPTTEPGTDFKPLPNTFYTDRQASSKRTNKPKHRTPISTPSAKPLPPLPPSRTQDSNSIARIHHLEAQVTAISAQLQGLTAQKERHAA
ncbi:MAG: hypothetical protein Q9160_000328 [Pyrenula sp. 1 TL-2023]